MDLRREIAYSTRRSDRSRRVRVVVSLESGVEVVLPRWAGQSDAADAVVELRPWIERRLAELDDARRVLAEREGFVPYLGEELLLVPDPRRTRVHRKADRLLVPEGDARPALERWFRRRARAEVQPRLQRACAESGLAYTKLTIRNQRTRWGSCSADGAMSFNWRLLLAPEQILDYVVWHEVCHLRHHDHSPRFWALLERHRPTWREEQRWLRDHGATLVLG